MHQYPGRVLAKRRLALRQSGSRELKTYITWTPWTLHAEDNTNLRDFRINKTRFSLGLNNSHGFDPAGSKVSLFRVIIAVDFIGSSQAILHQK